MFYTIQNGQLLMAENKTALSTYYDNVLVLPEDYEDGKYIVENGRLVRNLNYEEEVAQRERERIAKLSLTKREVFLALYQAKGVIPEQIKAQITDPMALIEFEYANDYYRFNPLIDVIGSQLGFTSEQLDKFFITKDYHELLPSEQAEVTDEDTTNNAI